MRYFALAIILGIFASPSTAQLTSTYGRLHCITFLQWQAEPEVLPRDVQAYFRGLKDGLNYPRNVKMMEILDVFEELCEATEEPVTFERIMTNAVRSVSE